MSTTLTLENKNTLVLTIYLKHGQEPTLEDIKDFTFNNVVFPEGTVLKDLTFQQFVDATLILEDKN